MHQIWNKPRARRGETVAEVLLAVLVAGVSMALLAGAALSAARLNRTAIQTDAAFYAQLSAAEGRTGPGENGTLAITVGSNPPHSFPVTVYGGEGELRAYGKR